jgi:hypothetical protein
MQSVANMFASEVRKSAHRFADPADLQKRLIYNYAPVNQGYGSQLYVF